MQVSRDGRTPPGRQNLQLPDLNTNPGSSLRVHPNKPGELPRETSETSTMPSSAFQGRDINMLPNLKNLVTNKRIPAYSNATKAQNRLQNLKKSGNPNSGVYNSPDSR